MGQVHDLGTLTDADRPCVGGKAANLGRMLRAGLPVPPGFVVDEDVPADDPAIAAAFASLGGPVAARSSAVGEDEAGAAAAGVYRSQLGVRTVDELVAAIEDVRRSTHAAHVGTYQPGDAARMVVIVQTLVEADVAGVVFTRDPHHPADDTLVVNAAWGLGTTVVNGDAADRFRVSRSDGQVRHATIVAKRIRETTTGRQPVPAEQVDVPCLTPAQLRDLTTLVLAVETLFGEPCDIEWALAGDRFWLLQSRPITVAPAVDVEALRRRGIDALRPLVGPHGTVWRRYDLAESAPRPTPMTWAVLRTMLSVRGGYGRMLRGLGFDPDPRADEAGFVQLIAGQPYLNVNQEARLDFRDMPYTVDVDRLRREPARALAPQRELILARTPPRFWLRLPAILWRAWRQSRRLRSLRDRYADDLTGRVFPAFAAAVTQARQTDLAILSNEALVTRFEEWRERTLVEFAASALQPAVFASLAMHDLLRGADDAERVRRLEQIRDALATAGRPAGEDHPAALAALLRGSIDLATFLPQFGHRGPEELELAQPRWSEVPPALDQRAAGFIPAVLFNTAGINPAAGSIGRSRHVQEYRTAVALRETGRHYLMMGYSHLRELLLELDRRLRLAGGIFFLRPDELPAAVAGEPVADRVRTRRREYNLLRHVWVPTVLFGDDLKAIGRPAEPTTTAADWTGQPIAPGHGEGPALVATTPADLRLPVRPGFVLVCPSADAAWLPVLVHAAAVVLETGSDLSHGAILLRELGIPAVAGLPGVMTAVATGDRLRVDGHAGTVARIERL